MPNRGRSPIRGRTGVLAVLVTVAVLTGGAVGGWIITQPGPTNFIVMGGLKVEVPYFRLDGLTTGPDIVFVDANNGNDSTCARQASPTTTLPANGQRCKTWGVAYSKANPGDNIGVLGNFTKQVVGFAVAKTISGSVHCDWTIPDYSGCITFRPANPGDSIIFDRNDAVATHALDYCDFSSTTKTCDYGNASITLGGGPLVNGVNCLGDPAGGTQLKSQEQVVVNIQSNDTFGMQGNKLAIINSVFDVGDAWRPDSATSHINACGGSNGTKMPAQDILFGDGSVVKNLIGTHLSNQQCAIPGGGTQLCQDWRGQHYEALHLEGGQRVTIRQSYWLNSSGHDIFGEPEDGTPSSDWLWENNVFDYACSHQTNIAQGGTCGTQNGTAGVACHPDPMTNMTVRFNTFLGDFNSATAIDNGPYWAITGCAGAWTGTLRDYGNIYMDSNESTFGCNNRKNAGVVVYSNTYWSTAGASSGNCDSNTSSPSSVVGNPLIPGFSNYDPTLSSGSPAINLVAVGVAGGCPTVDISGAIRPVGDGFCNAGAYDPTLGAANKGTGGSTATCSPSPCTPAALSSVQTVAADDGAGTTKNHNYFIYRPAGLTNSSNNLVPAVIFFSADSTTTNQGTPAGYGCNASGGAGACDLRPIADAEKFIIVYFNSFDPSGYSSAGVPPTPNARGVTPCPFLKNLAANTCVALSEATPGANCTVVSGTPTRQCYDGFGLTALLNKIVCSGVSPCENIDPNKVFGMGMSKGGTGTEIPMCDQNLVGRFRGFVIWSAQIFGSTPNGIDNNGPYQCPALAAQTSNDFSVEWQYGDIDSLLGCGAGGNGGTLQAGCVAGGLAPGTNNWVFGQDDNAKKVAAPALGCSTTPTSTTGGNGQVFIDTYGGCVVPFRAVRIIRAHNCGHALPGLQGCDSFDSIGEAWNFLKNH